MDNADYTAIVSAKYQMDGLIEHQHDDTEFSMEHDHTTWMEMTMMISMSNLNRR